MARNMLKGKDLANTFQAEAVHTVMYLINRSPTKVVKNMKPKAWRNKKPQVSHEQVFGGKAFVHILKRRGTCQIVRVKKY